MFKEVHSVVKGGEVVHVGDVFGAAVTLEPDVELSQAVKLYVTKTGGGQWA